MVERDSEAVATQMRYGNDHVLIRRLRGDDMQAYEKLGLFYLGRARRQGDGGRERVLLYDSKDLVTHAICVGMTGSGKTGLCIDLLEEAAIDGVPSLVIDPKGDLGNLLLTFPIAVSRRSSAPGSTKTKRAATTRSPDEWAAAQAEAWKKGLADWDQDGDRIRRLRGRRRLCDLHARRRRQACRCRSSTRSRRLPPISSKTADLMRERVATTATSLLGLIGIDADPVKSREHILLSTLIDAAWRQGQDLTIASLIQLVQSPP